MGKFETEIMLNADIEYDYTEGCRERFDKGHGNWLPGDPSDVDNIKVMVMVPIKAVQDALERAQSQKPSVHQGFVYIDLYGALSEPESKSIENDCYENEES